MTTPEPPYRWSAGTVLTPDGTLTPGTVTADATGTILEVTRGTSPAAVDLGASTVLVPGAVDLHGDAVEKLVEPRPGVRMPFDLAVRALDRRLAAAGVTTSFSALSFAGDELGLRDPAASAALARSLSGMADPFVEHRVHLRVEVTDEASVSAAVDAVRAGGIGLLSVMNHTPGQGQFTDLESYVRYHEKTYAATPEESRRRAEAKVAAYAAIPERLTLLAGVAKVAGLALAWHDPDSAASVERAAGLGATIAEFPTVKEALLTANERGLTVAMGAPNLLRRSSSSGNLSAVDAMGLGTVDVLVSDYYPETLWPAAWSVDLPVQERAELVAGRPARAAGLTDRGRIEPGLRADLVGLAPDGTVRCTLVAGRRVA